MEECDSTRSERSGRIAPVKKMNRQDVLDVISADQWMMGVLRVVRDLGLPDCWVGAGFVRGKVWDYLHGYQTRTPLSDVDVIYYDIDYPEESFEREMEARLREKKPEVNWSVKNQARMHLVNGERPYANTSEAVGKWPERCTAVAIRLNKLDQVELLAPWGIDDLVDMVVRPTPAFANKMNEFHARQGKKQWKVKWPKVKEEY